MKETALITGATGYLGSQLLEGLFRTGYEVIAYKRSTSDLKRLEKYSDRLKFYNADQTPPPVIFEENKIDYVIHCATNYGRGGSSLDEIVSSNVLFPLKILEAARAHNLKCFINTDTALGAQVSSYALSKAQFRDWLKLFSENFKVINIRLQHFYGPGDDPYKFISWLTRNLLADVEKLDLTSGEQKRDFIYIEDVTRAYLELLNSSKSSYPDFLDIDLGSGEAPGVREVVELIKEIAEKINPGIKTKLNFGARPYRPQEEMRAVADLGPIQKILNWKPETSLRAGMEKTVTALKNTL